MAEDQYPALTPRLPPRHEVEASLSRGQRRVLLVEDEPHLRSTLARALALHGYGVEAVEGSVAAQAALACGGIDLLLTDVLLGGALDGFQLAFWARDRLPRLPMVLISGLALSFPPQALLDDAAVWMLPKPFSAAGLMAILRNALALTHGLAH